MEKDTNDIMKGRKGITRIIKDEYYAFRIKQYAFRRFNLFFLLSSFFFSVAFAFFSAALAFAQAPAFPGAEGSGRYVTGGRGGKIIHVTNLNDSGTGSLRAALKTKGAKTIVFDVGGVIALQSDLQINDNTTILGQTAPYPGVTLRYYTTELKGDNIIVRFLRFRRGQERDVNDGADTFWGRRHTGVIIDHCSMSWSIDEIGSFYDNNNFTLQWCVYGESLNNAGHGKGAHGYGGIWGGKLASFHHNMIAHTNNRAPRFNGARYNWSGYTANSLYSTYQWANAVQAENVDFRNCLVFDWGGGGCYGGPGGGYINMVNNYYKSTPETSHKNRVTTVSIANSTTSSEKAFMDMTSRYYISGNFVYGSNYGANYDWRGVAYDSGIMKDGDYYYSRDSLNAYGDAVTHYIINGGRYVRIRMDSEVPAPVGTVTTHSAEQAYAKVMAYGGASLFRDDVDARYMSECAAGQSTYTGSVTGVKGRIDVVADCDGYTEANFPTGKRADTFDTDGDGMPDAWETANGLNPADASDANAYTLDAKGWYTNLEVYANSLVEPIVKAQNKDAVTPVDEYYPACKQADGMDYYTGRLVERVSTDTTTTDTAQVREQLIYTTNFTDWTDVKANNNSPVNVKKTTRYSDETITFKVFDTEISSTNKNTAKFPSWEGGYLMAAKSSDPYVTTTALKSITKVHFLHGATGSKRGWKLEAKGDGDSDWVVLSSSVASPATGADVTVNVNRANCQLRFTNLNSSQNAYLFQLDIYGDVDMTGKETPSYTVSYLNADGTVVAKQTVKQDSAIGTLNDGSAVTVPAGSRFRGWLMTANGSQKVTEATTISADTSLYPLITDIEGDDADERDSYDLRQQYFYAEDHEAFVPTSAYVYRGSTHGRLFQPGSIQLKVSGNATIIVEACTESKGAMTLTDASGNTIGTVAVPTADGTKTLLDYTGPAATLTLSFTAETAIHAITIINTGDATIAKSPEGYYVARAGSANSVLGILDVIEAREDGKSRVKIFLPNGTYDFGTMTERTLPVDNISLIGQSMDSTLLVTAPEVQKEGLGTADMFFNTRKNIYFQDLTLRNALGYYQAGGAGRAAVIQDRGNRTIYKNVRMLSYQDTYYSQNNAMQSYFEGCDVHGTVDFICGGGDVRFDNTTISLEPRNADGTGGRTITAPSTTTDFGYVFDGCRVVDLSAGKGNWNYSRTWRNAPICVWLNTTLDNNAAKTIVASRWTQKGMNNTNPRVFGEYATKNEAGRDITPASNVITSYDGTHETILTATQAAAYSYDKMFTDWNPKQLSAQLEVTGFTVSGTTLSWNATPTATAYAVFKDGVLQAITSATQFSGYSADGRWTVRAANEMGGFGPEAVVGATNGIAATAASTGDVARVEYYSLSGMRLSRTTTAPAIVRTTMADGTVKTTKIVRSGE